jgi:hypothetical protein
VSLYTTITLGGYGEMLLFGTVLLILGHQVTHESADSWWRWGLMGCIAGLAFWTLPLSVVYMVPVGLAILLKWRWRHAGQYGLALAAFALGSSPWWGYCLGHGDACLQPLLDSPAELVVSGGWLQTLWHRVFSLLLLGIPSLWGLRYPWTAELIVSPLVVPVLALYLGSIVYALRAKNRHRFLPLAMGATFLVVFLGTPFGNDATGRYLLPLYLLVALLAAEMLSALRARSRWLAAAGLACLVAFNTGGTLWAALTEPAGLTAQLDARLQFGNEHDAELIAFLQESGEQYGYGNYWLAFKINFLSGEEIVVAPRLPYKANLTYNPADDRYPAYSRLVDGAPGPPFYLTCNQPELDTRLRQALDAGEIDYQEQVIGAYHVFYSLSVAASPEELGIHGEQ